MVSRGFFGVLALLRIAAGVSLLLAGISKLSWFSNPGVLEQTLTGFAAHAANPLVAKYVGLVQPHYALFARVVVVGELGLGALLIIGFLTPLASLLAFLMVLQFFFASSQVFTQKWYSGSAGLVYTLQFLVIFAGRGGTLLGLDGMLGGRKQKPS
jgi:uncharacterized membrane protein YphA (DoxX/SURF4 family)